MLAVKDSFYAYLFDEFEEDIPVDYLALLDDQEAEAVWFARVSQVQKKNKHLFNLEEGNWINKSQWVCIGQLSENPDQGELDQLRHLLGAYWQDDEPLYLIQRSNVIVSLNLRSLCQYWPEANLICDDSPILISQAVKAVNVAICLTTIGNIRMAQNSLGNG